MKNINQSQDISTFDPKNLMDVANFLAHANIQNNSKLNGLESNESKTLKTRNIFQKSIKNILSSPVIHTLQNFIYTIKLLINPYDDKGEILNKKNNLTYMINLIQEFHNKHIPICHEEFIKSNSEENISKYLELYSSFQKSIDSKNLNWLVQNLDNMYSIFARLQKQPIYNMQDRIELVRTKGRLIDTFNSADKFVASFMIYLLSLGLSQEIISNNGK